MSDLTDIKMAVIPKKALAFCRWTICLLFWATAALCFFGVRWFIFLPFAIMLLSGILTVRRAPLILLYIWLFDRERTGETDVVNVSSIRFSHFVGAAFCTAAVLSFYLLRNNTVGYVFVGILTVLQTAAACGYCSAQKLYECLVLGKNCCGLGKKLRGGSCDAR